MTLPLRSRQEMNKASLEQWLQRLETIHPTEVELGLERVASVARTLELLPVLPPVITVAGTNGKGSTVAVLEALLIAAGYRTGSYTSPHLIRFNERIKVGGVEASDENIVSAFARIDDARGEVSLTYFEFATLAALLVFRDCAVNFVVLEVGLGGRLDAANIIDASMAVITSIDLDHQGWLGDSRAEIAIEKAGILRNSTPVVVADPNPPPELVHCIAQLGARPALFIGNEFTLATGQGEWQAVLRTAGGEPRCFSGQQSGSMLPENICAAMQALLLLDIPIDDAGLPAVLAGAAPRGRRQLRRIAERDYVLDVAHNPAAVCKLLDYLRCTSCEGKTIGLFSVMADKDLRRIVDATAGYFQAWFLADQPGNARAAKAADVADVLHELEQRQVSISKNFRQAFRRAHSIMVEGDRLVVFGSFTTVAAILPILDSLSNASDGQTFLKQGEGQ